MGVKDHFCCGLNTRRGTIFSAFFTLFTSVMCMSLALLRFSSGTQKDLKQGMSIISYGSFALYSLLIIISFVAIAGATLERKGFLLLWLLFMVLVLAFEALVIVAEIEFIMPTDKSLHKWDIFNIVFYSLRTAIQVYSIICVSLQYHALGSGTGTREYFQEKKEARHLRITNKFKEEMLDAAPVPCEQDHEGSCTVSLDEHYIQSYLLEADTKLQVDFQDRLLKNIAIVNHETETTYDFCEELKTCGSSQRRVYPLTQLST